MNEVETVTITLYVGLKIRETGEVLAEAVAKDICSKYVNGVGLCVSIQPVDYIYTDGDEPGVCITLINYPRFPSTESEILAHAMALGRLLLHGCKQLRLSIVSPKKTIMLSREAE